jgi:hypothetical protein
MPGWYTIHENAEKGTRWPFKVKNWKGFTVSCHASLETARKSVMSWDDALDAQLALCGLDVPNDVIDEPITSYFPVATGENDTTPILCPFCLAEEPYPEQLVWWDGDPQVLTCEVCGCQIAVKVAITEMYELEPEEEDNDEHGS